MTDKELDNLFKNSFEGHEMPVPADMWARIQLPEKEKRRGILWWTWLTAAAVIILVGAATWLYINHQHSAENKIALEKPSVKGDKTSKQALPSAKPEQAAALDAQSIALNKSVTAATEKERLTRKKLRDPITVNNIKNRKQYSTPTQNNRNITKVTTKVPGSNLPTEPNNSPESIRKADEQENYQTSDANYAININDSSIALHDKQKEEIKADSVRDNIAAATPVHVKKMHKSRLPAIELLISGNTGDRKIYEVQKPPISATRAMAAIDPQTKTVMQGFSASVKIIKPIAKNISVKTGVQFLQMRQSVSYLQETINEYSVLNTTGFITDTARYAQISMKRPTLRSMYSSVNVHLLVSYEKGNKIKAGVTAGIIVNLFSWYKGDVPSADYRNMLLAKDVFKVNSGTSLYLSASAAKSFGNWQLFAEPHIQYGLSSITKPAALFKQKMNNYGIGIGIRKNFQKPAIRK